MKRIENIISLIEELNDQEPLLIADDLGFDPGDLGHLTIEQIKSQIIDFYNRNSRDAIMVEDSVHMLCDIDRIVFTKEFISDMEIKMKSWFVPLKGILDYYGFEYLVDYMNETIYLHNEDYSLFGQKTGIDEETIIRFGINDFLFAGFETKINRLYQEISRKDKIRNL